MTTELAKTTQDLPEIVRERGIKPEVWNALKTSIFPGASDEMVIVASEYCRARGLDPMKKPVHIVQTWDSRQRKMVDTIWTSITEIRTTAMRTGAYAGRDQTEFGPDAEFEWREEGQKQSVTHPEWAQVTVYRMVAGQKCPFPGPRVYWREAYAAKKNGGPNAMWNKRPYGQLDKCAEAAALRAAFPEEIGGQNTSDEMEGQTIDPNFIGDASETEVTPRPKAPRPGGVAAAQQTERPAEKPAEPVDEKPTEQPDQAEQSTAEEKAEDKPSEDEETVDAEFEEAEDAESEEELPPPVTPETIKESQKVECRADINAVGSPKQLKSGSYVTKVEIKGDAFEGSCFVQHNETDPPFHPGAAILGTITGQKTSNGTKPMFKLGEWRVAK